VLFVADGKDAATVEAFAADLGDCQEFCVRAVFIRPS
jgi:hypothetical protein